MSPSLRRYDAHETSRMLAVHGAELASFPRRAAALAVDFLIAGLLFLTLIVPVGMLLERLGMIQPDRDVTLHLNFFRNWYSIVWLVLYFGLATWIGNGRTPGKRLTGIRVVSLVHGRMGLWQSLERALGYGASALEFGFGFAQYFVHPNRRTVHDRIAETIVVADKRPPRAGEPEATASEPPG
jgi:uncharacterized RDD family membrane protein YckC